MEMYLKTKLKFNIKELYIGCILLLLSFLVRIYSYLFGDVGIILTLVMWITFGMLLLMAFIKLKSFKNIFYDSLLNVSVVFWLWTCLSTILNMTNALSLINDLITLSFGFVFLLFFSYSSRDLCDNDISFVKKIAAFFIILVGVVYILWIIGDGDVSVSGARNSVYYCLLLLPIIFIQKNKVLVAVEIIVLFIAVLLSGKRAAFIVFAMALLLPLILSLKKGDKKKGERILLLILIIVALIIVYNYLSTIFDISLFDRFGNLIEDEGSGRWSLYQDVWEGFDNSSFLGKLFGHGFNGVANDKIATLVYDSTIEDSTTSAHNDFLEVLYDYGIVGLVLYLGIIIKLFSIALVLKKKNLSYFKMYISAIISFIVMSMFSHLIIYPTYIAFLWMFFSLGSSRQLKEEK